MKRNQRVDYINRERGLGHVFDLDPSLAKIFYSVWCNSFASGTKEVSEDRTVNLAIRTPVGHLIKAPQWDVRSRRWKISHPFTQLAPSYKKGRKKRVTADGACILVRVGGLKRARRWEENERLWTSSCSGVDYPNLWCSHRFHEAHIKATAGGKGQAKTHEDSCWKGNTKCNLLYVIKEEQANNRVCTCPSFYVCVHAQFKSRPPCSSLNAYFLGNLLGRLLCG